MTHTRMQTLMQQNSMTEFPYQHVMVTGADAFDFLQGQLTLDLKNINDTTCLPAGYCNHKGQLFAVLWLYQSEQTLHFFVHQQVVEKALQRLKMFVLRSDVEFTTTDMRTCLLTPASAQQLSETLPQQHGEKRGQFIRVGEDCHYFIHFNEELPATTVDTPEQAQALKVASGALDVVESTYETLLPFQSGLSELKGISYDKGCYVGQEVIAINKYRGRNDKHLTLAILTHTDPVNVGFTVGDMLRDDDGKALGMLTDLCVTDEHTYLQVIMSDRTIGTEVTVQHQKVTFTRIFNQT